MNNWHLSSWTDWSSWLFGLRLDWKPFMHFVVIEVGPFGFCAEYDDPADTGGEAESP